MKNMMDIIWYDSVDSTNTQARRTMAELPPISVISAREQTAGRGQRGNSWKSEAGSNLTFSMVLKFGEKFLPPIKANCQFVISEAVALGIRDFLESEGVSARIKWPNDIYVGDKKICGILIENTISGEVLTSCIAGAGLNLNQTDFPADLPNPVSLRLLTGKRYDIESTLEKTAIMLGRRLGKAYSNPESLRESYLSVLYRKNEAHRYIDKLENCEFTGIIRGITDSALLQVECSDGRVKEFSFKEIEYIL